MAEPIPDVSFPIQGRGETARVSDRLPLRLFSLSGCTIDASWGQGGKTDMVSPFWRLYLNLDDGAEVRTASRTFALRAGHLYVVPAWLSWRAFTPRAVRHGNALLDLPSIGRERARSGIPLPLELSGPKEPLGMGMLALIRELTSAAIATEAQEAQGHALVWSALARMFTLADARSGPGRRPLPPLSSRGDFAFQKILDWAEEHLHESLDRPSLSRFAGLSEAELARRFQENLGTSPARWVRERRISFAAELLRSTDEPLEAIAERSGLGDRAHFSKVFAKWCGCPPATWRRNERG